MSKQEEATRRRSRYLNAQTSTSSKSSDEGRERLRQLAKEQKDAKPSEGEDKDGDA